MLRCLAAAAEEPGEVACEGLNRAGWVVGEPLYIVGRLLGETVKTLNIALSKVRAHLR
jgi:hypothetical protein